MPVIVMVGLVIVGTGFVAAVRRESRPFRWMGQSASVAVLLALTLVCVSGLQNTKNFYEAGIEVPMLGLAVLLALPSALAYIPCGRKVGLVAVVFVALFSAASQLALVGRFSQELPKWLHEVANRESRQADLGDVIAKCGLPTGQEGSRIVMDDFAYTLLWRTREPLLLAYFNGWWATDLDRNKLIRERRIRGLVGGCSAFPREHLPATINYPEIGFCCSRIEPRSSNER